MKNHRNFDQRKEENDDKLSSIIYGRNPVLELLKSQKRAVNKILISKTARGSAVSEIISIAKQRGISLHFVFGEKLDQISENSQGIAAEVSAIEYIEIEDLIKKSKQNPKPLLVLLDGISDPHNLGAIIRNCAVFGADGAIIPKWRAAGVNETVAKTSAGAVEYVPISRVSNLNNAIGLLKKSGFWIAGAQNGEKKSQSIVNLSFPFPLAIIIGSEGGGLHRITKESCDYIVSIPQQSEISSLNAACAAAILLYEVSKLR
ncbi:MAG: 23S rRNA (guanosine(2251)-2'-O)-methyltransferase RlmB [Elusimicrobiota bacterium]|jgi:23S rRNA (guanosine2251-2'-O)-methyltransferase|nr:23S rRNA (guanosine(2251)-2'-O)-methyltransferase RlmB [Elusimicrobiota bacterium]